MLFIDPESCIDCGACVHECPVDAIFYEDDLPNELRRFADINARYFRQHPLELRDQPAVDDRPPIDSDALRVAVVGSGPAGLYAASELLSVQGVEVDIFDRLPTPYGLIRAGVAPDHQDTKSIVNVFERSFSDSRLGCHLNVEVGRDVTHQDLMAHHHAVIYAAGATRSRAIGIPGEDLPGSHAAAEFVGWYNGHPDYARHEFDLSGERVVIVGNGNVALDVARVLLMEPDDLAKTDIADHALTALSQSNIREVVILGRRGIADAAFSVGELLALGHTPGVDIVVHGDRDGSSAPPGDDVEAALRTELVQEYARRALSPNSKRIVLRFMTSPAEMLGTGHVTGLRVVENILDENGYLIEGERSGDGEVIESQLILRSIGYESSPIVGLPFDREKAVIRNDRGRVTDCDGQAVPGVYVTGWIKRGAKGVIGTNHGCAQETLAQLWEDFDNHKLRRKVQDRDALEALLARRGADPVDWQGWRAIDLAERVRGQEVSRPRIKFVDRAEMVAESRRVKQFA